MRGQDHLSKGVGRKLAKRWSEREARIAERASEGWLILAGGQRRRQSARWSGFAMEELGRGPRPAGSLGEALVIDNSSPVVWALRLEGAGRWVDPAVAELMAACSEGSLSRASAAAIAALRHPSCKPASAALAALARAAWMGHAEVVALILPLVRSDDFARDGLAIADMAKRRGHPACSEAIRNHPARAE